ncbi:MAG: UpxY family transcription antiterminator [Planctomyces sp.]|nr:UpxY family transcription antiterminator [Planctomyces sp.]
MPLIGPERSLSPDDLFSESYQASGTTAGWRWWAMYTRSRQEKQLMRRLNAQDAAFYSPIIAHRYRSPAGRSRTSHLPLFANYVFLFGDETQRYAAMASGCVSRCIDVANHEGLVRDLSRIQRLIDVGTPVTAESRIEAGTPVRIKSGSLLGLEGVVFKRHGLDRLLVTVDFLQQGASVELADWEVERLA